MKENNKYRQIYYFILVTGILLRVIQFLYNRSLVHDEAALALGLIDFDISVFQPLPNQQSAPILFLLIERFFIILFGKSEYTLRLFPLICSLISLPLFRIFVLRFSKDEKTMLISFALFSFSPLLIYYSSVLKPYIVDTMVFLFLIIIGYGNSKQAQKYLWLSFWGVIFIFLSNIAVFILFVIYIWFFSIQIKEKKFHLSFFISGITILVAFAFNYLLFVRNNPLKEFMVDYWQFAFMPLNPFTTDFWSWLITSFSLHFKRLLAGFIVPNGFIYFLAGLSLFLFLIGIVKNVFAKKIEFVYVILSPVILHMLISSLELYPFRSRLILYLSPLFIAAVASGIIYFHHVTKKYFGFSIAVFLWSVIAAISLFIGFGNYPLEREEIKKSIQFVEENFNTTDKLIISDASTVAFDYYAQINFHDLENDSLVDMADLENDISFFTKLVDDNRKTWFILSHITRQQREKVLTQLENQALEEYSVQLNKSTGSLAFCIQKNE